jgi:hypothetical protein
MAKKPSYGVRLRDELGFNLSSYNFSSDYYRVACSQCQALVINGVPCHETDCANDPHRRADSDDDYNEGD